MKKRIVSIITGWGGNLGTGHLQRMANLADYINRNSDFRAVITCERIPGILPTALRSICSDTLNPDSIIIIRDKRDSGIDEMENLKRVSPVIAIDDCGAGRERADHVIDLLPNLTYSIYNKDQFIYGYNFTDSIRRLGNRRITKGIDYALYCGCDPSSRTIDFILSLIPEHSSCAILGGDDSRLRIQGTMEPLRTSYAETLLSSRILISHFGITLYEGYRAGCRLLSINPTAYHSLLSDKAAIDLGLVNLGTMDDIDPVHARSVVSDSSRSLAIDSMDPADINAAIEKGLALVMSSLQSFIA